MGAWGIGAFDNDAAGDWLAGRFADRGAAAVAGTLDAVNGRDGAGYLDADDGAEARAAAEVVAIAHGAPPAGLDQTIGAGIRTHAGDIRELPDIIRKANGAVARVWADNSELNELHAEAGGDDWNAAMNDLTSRLAEAQRNQP